jgi:DNA-binding PadR family transcriptional regulator
MSRERESRDLIPLNPRSLMVLLGLADGRAHGYEIKKRAEERGEGRVSLDAGSLYRTLAHFLTEGVIQEVEATLDDLQEDARRRYYELTPKGREVLSMEVSRLAELIDFARSRDLVRVAEATK